jgi:hypothetical protein
MGPIAEGTRKPIPMPKHVSILRGFLRAGAYANWCGTQVSVELLKTCTEYSSCRPEDRHVQFFWQVRGKRSAAVVLVCRTVICPTGELVAGLAGIAADA